MPEITTVDIGGKEVDIDNAVLLWDGEYAYADDPDVVQLYDHDGHEGDHAYIDDCVYIENAHGYVLEDDAPNIGYQECCVDGTWYTEQVMQYGYYERSHNQGWFMHDDYVYSEDTGEYYFDAEVAGWHGVHWCEGCDEYRCSDHHDHDYCTDGNSEECNRHFDNTFRVLDNHTHKTFGMKYTFGVEIETHSGRVSSSSLQDISVKAVYDGSISGLEYVTGPLQGNKGVEQLKSLCEVLSKNCTVNKTCGIHVHIGGASFNRRFSILSIMLGLQIQDELYDMLPKSRRTGSYCYPIADIFKEIRLVSKTKHPRLWNKTLQLLNKYVSGEELKFNRTNNKKVNHPGGHYASTRYKWLNLNNCSYKDGPDTIEFRQHSGSLDFNKIYNWLLICMSIVRYIENNPRDIYWGHIGKGPIVTVRGIIHKSLPKEDANKLVKYIDKRTDKFS